MQSSEVHWRQPMHAPLGAAQASSAREAAQLLGSLVERLGAGEGFGVLLADPQEAWYLETASGHHWAAQRVPDDAFFVSANQVRFQVRFPSSLICPPAVPFHKTVSQNNCF